MIPEFALVLYKLRYSLPISYLPIHIATLSIPHQPLYIQLNSLKQHGLLLICGHSKVKHHWLSLTPPRLLGQCRVTPGLLTEDLLEV